MHGERNILVMRSLFLIWALNLYTIKDAVRIVSWQLEGGDLSVYEFMTSDPIFPLYNAHAFGLSTITP